MYITLDKRSGGRTASFFVGRNKIELYRAVVELQKNILGGIRNADRTVTKRNDSSNEGKR